MKVLFINLGIYQKIFLIRGILFLHFLFCITKFHTIFFMIDYVLPWGQVTDWFNYHLVTYFDMYMIFLVFYLNQKI